MRKCIKILEVEQIVKREEKEMEMLEVVVEAEVEVKTDNIIWNLLELIIIDNKY